MTMTDHKDSADDDPRIRFIFCTDFGFKDAADLLEYVTIYIFLLAKDNLAFSYVVEDKIIGQFDHMRLTLVINISEVVLSEKRNSNLLNPYIRKGVPKIHLFTQ